MHTDPDNKHAGRKASAMMRHRSRRLLAMLRSTSQLAVSPRSEFKMHHAVFASENTRYDVATTGT